MLAVGALGGRVGAAEGAGLGGAPQVACCHLEGHRALLPPGGKLGPAATWRETGPCCHLEGNRTHRVAALSAPRGRANLPFLCPKKSTTSTATQFNCRHLLHPDLRHAGHRGHPLHRPPAAHAGGQPPGGGWGGSQRGWPGGKADRAARTGASAGAGGQVAAAAAAGAWRTGPGGAEAFQRPAHRCGWRWRRQPWRRVCARVSACFPGTGHGWRTQMRAGRVARERGRGCPRLPRCCARLLLPSSVRSSRIPPPPKKII